MFEATTTTPLHVPLVPCFQELNTQCLDALFHQIRNMDYHLYQIGPPLLHHIQSVTRRTWLLKGITTHNTTQHHTVNISCYQSAPNVFLFIVLHFEHISTN